MRADRSHLPVPWRGPLSLLLALVAVLLLLALVALPDTNAQAHPAPHGAQAKHHAMDGTATYPPTCDIFFGPGGPQGQYLYPYGIPQNEFSQLFINVPLSDQADCIGLPAKLVVYIGSTSGAPTFTESFDIGNPAYIQLPPPFFLTWWDGTTALGYYPVTVEVTTPDGSIVYGTANWGTIVVGQPTNNTLCTVQVSTGSYQNATCWGIYHPTMGFLPAPH